SFVTRADTPVIIEQQASQQVNTQKYNISEFKIISSYRLLNKVSFVFMDSNKNKYTSEDLKKDGYKMVFIDLCNVDFVKGGKHEKVTC
ncbi:TPA: assembly protein, partial [Klebsiella pneumoniae]